MDVAQRERLCFLETLQVYFLADAALLVSQSWTVPFASVTMTWVPVGVKSAAKTVESKPAKVLSRVLEEMSHRWQHSSSPPVRRVEASGEKRTTRTPSREGWTKVQSLAPAWNRTWFLQYVIIIDHKHQSSSLKLGGGPRELRYPFVG